MLDTNFDVSTFTEIVEDFDFEDQCESLGHESQSDAHDDGGGVWYGHIECPYCDLKVIKLYCNTFSIACRANLFPVMCYRCFAGPILPTNYFKKFTRKG